MSNSKERLRLHCNHYEVVICVMRFHPSLDFSDPWKVDNLGTKTEVAYGTTKQAPKMQEMTHNEAKPSKEDVVKKEAP
jgi:hypothetical protein